MPDLLDPVTFGELLGLLAHDLRNPLSALHSNLGFLTSIVQHDKDALPALLTALKDEAPAVRLEAIRVLEKFAAGNLKALIGFDEAELDETGNIELRCWACAAGALGERKPEVVSMDPSWHHNYASLGWIGSDAEQRHVAHYPSIKPELVELTSALHGLAHDPEQRAQFLADARAFADRFRLPPEQREALIKLDLPSMVKMGAHPLAPFLAQLQIERLRPKAAKQPVKKDG